MNNIINWTTDQLFEVLPNFINVKGELYFLKISKNNKITVEYVNFDGELLDNTYRVGKSLRSALYNMVVFLNDFGYYNDMASGNRLLKTITKYDGLLLTPKQYAIKCHSETNHLYDGKPYDVHLSMVYEFGKKYSYLLMPEDVQFALDACWTHDLIEDARQTYNDVKNVCGEVVADITYALTNEKGKTRKERANKRYYDGIKAVKNAPFVKFCDRLANIKYSVESQSKMAELYKKEHSYFISNFKEFEADLRPMIEEMEGLFM